MKYIIDTDPGIDDAIAILMAHKYNLDIIGFTLVNGNIALDKSENNIKVLQDFMETNIKMYKGKHTNIIEYEKAEYAHGKDGLGYAVFPKNKRKFEKMSAEDFLIKAAKKYKDDLTIICFGPLTNIANAIKKDKNFIKNLKHLIIMSATYNPEDKIPYREFNISVDPNSAKLVFNSPFADIKVLTHEMGNEAWIEKEYISNLLNSNDLISRFIGLICIKYSEFAKEKYNIDGIACPDPATLCLAIDDKFAHFEPCKIDISENEDTKGLCYTTIVDNSNIKMVTSLNLDEYRKLFKNVFK